MIKTFWEVDTLCKKLFSSCNGSVAGSHGTVHGVVALHLRGVRLK